MGQCVLMCLYTEEYQNVTTVHILQPCIAVTAANCNATAVISSITFHAKKKKKVSASTT